ncbi:MAG: TonB-dependent receptor [Gammaproteobacteria bacterium]|nr:TonB-dependent receptor [Gammaproteobacteria bacterium]NNM00109.1 TonB-dependent receptor [Gammaproteobacteria bacterium]
MNHSVASTTQTVSRLLCGAAAASILASTAQAAVLEEVIVTAQKREQDIQDIPISVTAVDGEQLNEFLFATSDVRAIAARTPSLYAESSNGRVAPRFYMRGFGNSDFDLSASQPVSIIVDEVVLENVTLKSFPLFDIERVEVLRGPQGSLFGRNTTAGIVKFDTVKPSQETDGYMSLSYGRFNTINAQGAIGGAINDVLSARVSALYYGRSDWIDNQFTGDTKATGGNRDFAGRAQFLYEPTQNFSALLNVHARKLKGTSEIFRANIFTTGSNSLNQNFDRNRVQWDGGGGNQSEYDSFGVSLRMEYELANSLVLTSITAYETATGTSRGDIDGGFGAAFLPFQGPGVIAFPADTQDGIEEQHQITQELRIASDGSNRLDWQAGIYFFDSSVDISSVGGLPLAAGSGVFPVGAPFTGLTVQENTLWAVFGQFNYELTDSLELTAGLRYTDDDREAKIVFPLGLTDPSISDSDFSGDIALTWFMNENATVYGKYSRGFRGPSIQARVAFGGVPSTASGETVDSFEGGIKTTLFDGRARLNVSGYYYEVSDIQLTAAGGGANVTRLLNADQGTGYGIEVDLEASINDNLTLTSGFSWNETELEDNTVGVTPCGAPCTVLDVDSNGDGLVEIDGNPFPNAPEFVFNATAEYRYPVTNGDLFLYTDWIVLGETAIIGTLLYESAEFTRDVAFEGAIKAGYRRSNDEISVFVRNVTDEEYANGAIDFNNLTGFVNEPRIWGVSYRRNF